MSGRMRVLAVIPARGGSKGIPGKNVALLAGKPLLVHSIEVARSVPAVTGVVVSTDDDVIASTARHAGAEVVTRPAEISGDDASSETALLHVLESRAREGRPDPDVVLFLQATSPIRREGDVVGALRRFESEGADSLFSASPQQGFVWRLRGTSPESTTYDYRCRRRRQELEGETVVENGSFYLFKPWVLRTLGNRLGGVVTFCRMGLLESLQIDEPGDLELAEWVLRAVESFGWPPEPTGPAPGAGGGIRQADACRRHHEGDA